MHKHYLWLTLESGVLILKTKESELNHCFTCVQLPICRTGLSILLMYHKRFSEQNKYICMLRNIIGWANRTYFIQSPAKWNTCIVHRKKWATAVFTCCWQMFIQYMVPHCYHKYLLTLTVLVTTIYAPWEGMRDVASARYEPALLPPCPTIRVLSYSN